MDEAAQAHAETLRDSDAGDEGRVLIGWQERVAFPDWGVEGVLAKIDTGACVSALHVADVERLGGNRVAFHVSLDRKGSRLSQRIEAPLARETTVRSSNGQEQHRYIVRAMMDVGGVRREIEVSLVHRGAMRCRMLLGRAGLAGTFTVDPERDYLLTPRPVPKRKTKRAGEGEKLNKKRKSRAKKTIEYPKPDEGGAA